MCYESVVEMKEEQGFRDAKQKTQQHAPQKALTTIVEETASHVSAWSHGRFRASAEWWLVKTCP